MFTSVSFWLSVLALFLSLVGVGSALVYTHLKLRAERHYSKMLHGSESIHVRQMYAEYLSDGKLSQSELDHLVDELEAIARHLRSDERRFVLEALEQPSRVGRERYVEKLLAA